MNQNQSAPNADERAEMQSRDEQPTRPDFGDDKDWRNEDEAVTGLSGDDLLPPEDEDDLPNHGFILDPDAEEIVADPDDIDGETESEESQEYREMARSMR